MPYIHFDWTLRALSMQLSTDVYHTFLFYMQKSYQQATLVTVWKVPMNFQTDSERLCTPRGPFYSDPEALLVSGFQQSLRMSSWSNWLSESLTASSAGSLPLTPPWQQMQWEFLSLRGLDVPEETSFLHKPSLPLARPPSSSSLLPPPSAFVLQPQFPLWWGWSSFWVFPWA